MLSSTGCLHSIHCFHVAHASASIQHTCVARIGNSHTGIAVLCLSQFRLHTCVATPLQPTHMQTPLRGVAMLPLPAQTGIVLPETQASQTLHGQQQAALACAVAPPRAGCSWGALQPPTHPAAGRTQQSPAQQARGGGAGAGQERGVCETGITGLVGVQAVMCRLMWIH
jgi:hypothetical protein